MAQQLPFYCTVRTILLLVVLLLAVGSFAASFPAPPPARQAAAPPSMELEWVRTTDGWQRPASWGPTVVVPPPVHPAIAASLILLTSLWVLIAYPPKRSSATA